MVNQNNESYTNNNRALWIAGAVIVAALIGFMVYNSNSNENNPRMSSSTGTETSETISQ